jgi:hypothetical protein
MAFPPGRFPRQDLAQNQQHKRMSLECFCRLSFIIPNAPKKKKRFTADKNGVRTLAMFGLRWLCGGSVRDFFLPTNHRLPWDFLSASSPPVVAALPDGRTQDLLLEFLDLQKDPWIAVRQKRMYLIKKGSIIT